MCMVLYRSRIFYAALICANLMAACGSDGNQPQAQTGNSRKAETLNISKNDSNEGGDQNISTTSNTAAAANTLKITIDENNPTLSFKQGSSVTLRFRVSGAGADDLSVTMISAPEGASLVSSNPQRPTFQWENAREGNYSIVIAARNLTACASSHHGDKGACTFGLSSKTKIDNSYDMVASFPLVISAQSGAVGSGGVKSSGVKSGDVKSGEVNSGEAKTTSPAGPVAPAIQPNQGVQTILDDIGGIGGGAVNDLLTGNIQKVPQDLIEGTMGSLQTFGSGVKDVITQFGNVVDAAGQLISGGSGSPANCSATPKPAGCS
ncbi:MAG: hypothetical protein HQK54_14380 [Oligoflexales bacterium]|nr:hypothetical protein [Oligoflexales bacterium]